MNKKTVLIIDDEAPVVEALTKKLTLEGFDVLSADNGKEGLDRALAKNPDLVLLDIVMPVIDGITVLDSLKNNPKTRTTPVIILTNLDDASKVEASRKSGATDYLVKTAWTLEDIVHKINSALERD